MAIPSRNNTIDVMKAIGILSVVSFHCLGEVGLRKFHSFNMPLFFLLSGWAGIPELPISTIIKRLATRLAYVYLIFNTFAVVGKYMFPNLCNNSPMSGVPDFLINPALAPMQISWFLYFLFFYKFFHAVIYKVFGNTNKFYIDVSLLTSVICIKYILFYFYIKEVSFINFSIYYFSGTCIFYFPKKYYSSQLSYLGLFILSAVVIMNIFDLEIINNTFYSFLGIYGILSISYLFVKLDFLSKSFLFIGQRTMEIYLFHYFIQIAFRGKFSALHPSVAFTCLLCVSVFGSLMIALLLEEWKFGRNLLLGKF